MSYVDEKNVIFYNFNIQNFYDEISCSYIYFFFIFTSYNSMRSLVTPELIKRVIVIHEQSGKI